MEDPEIWFHTLATHCVEAQIYFHLNQLEVFHHLRSPGPQGARSAEIAERLRLDPRILDILLDYVSHVGQIISRDGDGGYRTTPFGDEVLARYSKTNGDRVVYNLFDVRIGAWGPLWTNLRGLLDQSITYGKDLHRRGEYAADGLFKLAAPLAPAIERVAARARVSTIVEIGPTSGILAQLAEAEPSRTYVGVDCKAESLRAAEALAIGRGVRRIHWLRGDLFETDLWLTSVRDLQRETGVDAAAPTLFFSCHFHEFLAGGKDRVVRAVERMAAFSSGPNAAARPAIVVLEQPRLEESQRGDVSLTQWLYAHSNVLIHHLIKNAQILNNEEWRRLLLDGGCSAVTIEETDGFGFTAFVGV